MNNWHIRISGLLLLYLVGAVAIFVVLTFFFTIQDITSVGQLFADVLLFPTVIIGFWITITEFRKSQATPKLTLTWHGDVSTYPDGDSLVIETPKYGDKRVWLMLFVKNESKTMTHWYSISFDIPSGLSRPMADTHTVRWHRGDKSCWSEAVNLEMRRYEFKSNGQFALYPNENIHIATIEIDIFSQIHYPDQVQIPYSVVTDKTEVQYGEYKIKIRPENLARRIPPEWYLEHLIIREQPPQKS